MNSQMRAWWWHRQGLDGSLAGASPGDILSRAGWARSVGGVGPYLTLFARGGVSRAAADNAVAALEIHELPAARGCTYVVPAAEYELALTLAQQFGDGEMRTAEKLGVGPKEIDRLCEKVVASLGDVPQEIEKIREQVGTAARSLGEAGKKKGISTTLPIALGRLQTMGLIRRVPIDGRLDQQRYRYVKWSPSPLATGGMESAEAFTELARRYFSWVGPATIKEFQWFSGLGVKTAKDAVAPLSLVTVSDTDRLLLPSDADTYASFKAATKPEYALVSSLDAISAARRDTGSLVDDADRSLVSDWTFGEKPGASLVDLAAHAILDRGRLIGYWEYDPDEQRIVSALFSGKKDKALERTIAETEAFVRDQLGDARAFSLDSPKSRRPKLEVLRNYGKA